MESKNDTLNHDVAKSIVFKYISTKINFLHNSWFQWALRQREVKQGKNIFIPVLSVPVKLSESFQASDSMTILYNLCMFAKSIHHDSKEIGSLNSYIVYRHDASGDIYLMRKNKVINVELYISDIIGYFILEQHVINNNKLPKCGNNKAFDDFIWILTKGKSSLNNSNYKLDKAQRYLLYDLHTLSYDYFSYCGSYPGNTNEYQIIQSLDSLSKSNRQLTSDKYNKIIDKDSKQLKHILKSKQSLNIYIGIVFGEMVGEILHDGNYFCNLI